MHSEHVTQIQPSPLTDPAEVIKTGIGTWRVFAIDLPLRIAAETMRFTGYRIQAQAEHLAALAGCGSLQAAVELQAAFLTKGVADYQTEATTLSHDVTEAVLAKAA
ncbi:phasin family protein [Methylobacterium nigriterrae]|uniref:phasin family protein n=1 Tax=Methylobacterium nigriterrae TaxID=3127512 RepID=UPI0030141D18